jgi:hypothetical protein
LIAVAHPGAPQIRFRKITGICHEEWSIGELMVVIWWVNDGLIVLNAKKVVNSGDSS